MIRIVKMSFDISKRDEFLEVFDLIKNEIRSFPGCSFVHLLEDQNEQGVFFTYSSWESTDALSAYRSSTFFQQTWQKIKPWFKAKPQAWSTNQLCPK